jgi:hypothetical protein
MRKIGKTACWGAQKGRLYRPFLLERQLWGGGELEYTFGFVESDDSALE